MLRLAEVGVQRDFRWLIQTLSVQIQSGECWHLQGENGAGKTTLLRALVGLRRLDAGQLYWQETPMRTSRAEFQRQVLYLGHQLGVTPELTVEENWLHFARLQGLSSSAATPRLATVLEMLGLSHKRFIPARDLSAGQKRRVGLARLWFADHRPLWLLDEPLTALDVSAVALIQGHIALHCDNGGAVLMTSHQPLDCTSHVLDLSDFAEHASANTDATDFADAADESFGAGW